MFKNVFAGPRKTQASIRRLRGMDTCMMGNVNVEGDGFARVGRERVMYDRGERMEKVKEKGEVGFLLLITEQDRSSQCQREKDNLWLLFFSLKPLSFTSVLIITHHSCYS